MTRLSGAILSCAAACGLAAAPSGAGECAQDVPAVRLMLHEPAVLAARMALLGNTPDEPAARGAAFRELFEAAGCAQINEQGKGDRRNVECLAPGTGDGVIVVGVSQEYDSLGSAALLPSLAEALAAVPRKHTYRWVEFSAHETVADRVNRVQKPKGATRLLDALSAEERARIRQMIHIGPIGYGSVRRHPSGLDPKLVCLLEAAARTAGAQIGVDEIDQADQCSRSGSATRATGGSYFDAGCTRRTDWSGGHDWQPFRRVGIPVFGVHSQGKAQFAGDIDNAAYLRSYRMLAIFLALVDAEL